ncbi:MAG: L-methionine/branched-chain amino acid transporter [Rhodocyclales bacterium]|nr:L-methionine/branched-chain amino acid transporter [Rhodocyclales bacterium]
MSQFNKTLGFGQGLGLLISALLGTGVFIVPELTVRQAGSDALWGWAVLVLAIIPVAFAFAQLGRRFPHAGGASWYVQLAFGERQGRVVGWMLLALMSVGLPAAMEMAVWFLNALLPLDATGAFMAKLVVLTAMVVVNLRGIQVSGLLLSVIAWSVAVVVLGLAALAWLAQGAGTVVVEAAGVNWERVSATAGLAFWSFIGVETLAHLSAEFKRPERDFPLALLIGVLSAGLVYWVGSWVILHHVGASDNTVPAMVVLFDRLVGGQGALFIGVFGFLSCVATMNIYLASIARMLWSLANDGAVDRRLAHINGQGVPARAVKVVALVSLASLAATAALGLSLEQLLLMSNGMIVLVYLLTLAAALKLLSRHHWPLSAFGCVVCLWLAWSVGWAMLYAVAIYAALWVALWWQEGRLRRLARCTQTL